MVILMTRWHWRVVGLISVSITALMFHEYPKPSLLPFQSISLSCRLLDASRLPVTELCLPSLETSHPHVRYRSPGSSFSSASTCHCRLLDAGRLAP